MICIGIDPGLTGAVAAVNERGLYRLADLPTLQRGNKGAAVLNQVDPAGLAKILREILCGNDKQEIQVFIEKAQAMPGKLKGSAKSQRSATTFSIGLSAGLVEGVVAAIGLTHQLVHPATWKAALKVPSGTGKEGARAMAIRLYPEAELHRKKDHNRAEAILIAKYGYDLVA